tara:strand:- start:174 stop:467 length:294 start_codon:yes stop_codon:yes gene_type:complete
MNKLAIARAKISNALFSNFGDQGLLIKKDGSEFEVLMVKEDKSFNLKEGFNVTSSSIKIQSSEKPELRDVLKIDDQEFIIKSSPRSLNNNIYELKVQ